MFGQSGCKYELMKYNLEGCLYRLTLHHNCVLLIDAFGYGYERPSGYIKPLRPQKRAHQILRWIQRMTCVKQLILPHIFSLSLNPSLSTLNIQKSGWEYSWMKVRVLLFIVVLTVPGQMKGDFKTLFNHISTPPQIINCDETIK